MDCSLLSTVGEIALLVTGAALVLWILFCIYQFYDMRIYVTRLQDTSAWTKLSSLEHHQERNTNINNELSRRILDLEMKNLNKEKRNDD